MNAPRLKIRIDPDEEQARFLDRQFGAVRFVFNTALAIKRHCYKVRGDRLSAKHDLKPLLAIQAEPQVRLARRLRGYALQQACINLDRAFMRCEFFLSTASADSRASAGRSRAITVLAELQ
jgi:putative transposase